MSIPAGTKFGQYEIVSLLGAGGMGEVYLARDTKLRRTVALKVIVASGGDDERAVRRLIREARTASNLRHPNIAHVYDIGEIDNKSFIVMEFVDGVTLRNQQRLPLLEILKVIRDVASALAAAHAVGIVHRDIKPENIIISNEGYVKVLDFGLAKQIEQFTASDPDASTAPLVLTDPGRIVGTVLYMSPEQVRGLDIDGRSDLWSLGVVMYELIAGRPPFEANTPSDLVSLILKEEPPLLARFERDLPESVEWLVMKSLVKDREGRYQTAREFLSDIERLIRRHEVDAEIERSNEPDNPSNSRMLRRTSVGSLTRSVERSSSLEYLVQEIRNHKRGMLIVAAALIPILLVGAYYASRLLRSENTPSSLPRTLTRLTFDQGLQGEPAWSPDGRFVAYTSDREGNFDIWIQPVGGGNPVQVTKSPAHDWQPDWSPDGNSIVFRSEREGGGLFVVPAFGGRERKISAFGYRPRWSPKGERILCLKPGERVNEYPQVLVVDLNGKSQEVFTSVSANESDAKFGMVGWLPDGERVSFLTNDGGFWTTELSSRKPIRSQVSAKVANQLQEQAIELGNFRWAPAGNALFFEGKASGVANIWRISVDPQTLEWVDGPVRLTTGSGSDLDIALSSDGKRLAFATTTESIRIWSVPFDPLTGKIKGAGQGVTEEDFDAWAPAISPDGNELVFNVRRHGAEREELWQKSLRDGSIKVLAVDEYSRFSAHWSPDGKQIAYTRYLPREPEPNRTYPIALIASGGGEERLLTTPSSSRDYLYDWSPDGTSVVASTNRAGKERYQVGIFSLSDAPQSEKSLRILAADDNKDLWGPRFSPDGRWICYLTHQINNPGVSVLTVRSIAEDVEIHVTDERLWSDKPRWSPDGKAIYFITNHRSMFLNVWGVRFDPTNGKVVGEPFRVTSFESPGLALPTSIRQLEISLNLRHLYFPLKKVVGSVWTLSDVDR
jgi:serine/threonine protein kinase